MSQGSFESAQDSVAEIEEGRIDVIERLASMTQEEVDELPYGFVVLDELGTILLYNRYESSLSRLPPESVVGKNWFKEVAPCTRVDAFYGRFRALVTSPDRLQEDFRFRFYFQHGRQDVAVQLVKAPQKSTLPLLPSESPSRIFMTVVRRDIPAEEASIDT